MLSELVKLLKFSHFFHQFSVFLDFLKFFFGHFKGCQGESFGYFFSKTKNLAKIKVNTIRYLKCFLSFQAKNMTLRSEWPAVSPCKAELNFPRLFSPITFKCTGGSRGSVWNMYGLSVFNVLKEERHQTMLLLLQGSAPRCKRFEL